MKERRKEKFNLLRKEVRKDLMQFFYLFVTKMEGWKKQPKHLEK